MSRWFRVYDEMLDDPKAQRLPPELFKAWVNLLCVASRSGGVLPCTDDIAFALRVTGDVTRDWISALREHGLIDVDPEDGSLFPHNWRGRQFKSDADPTAVERQRKKRAKDASGKGPIVTRDITPPRDRTDTETEKEESSLRSDSSAPSAADLFDQKIKISKSKTDLPRRRAELQTFGENWNTLAGELKLAQIEFIDPGSQREKAALRALGDLSRKFDCTPEILLAKIRGSPYLRGEVNDFRATFDWICAPRNFQKIMEDTYAAREKKPTSGQGYARR